VSNKLAALSTTGAGNFSSFAFSGGAMISPFLLYQALADAAVNDTKSKTASKMQSVFLTLPNDCFLIQSLPKLMFSLIQFQTNRFFNPISI
jgi:hypothetical protein